MADEITTGAAVCPLCRSTQSDACLTARSPEFLGEQHEIRRCEACGMLFQSPIPAPKELARYYCDDYYAYVAPEVKPRSHRLKVALWRRLGLLRQGRPAGPRWLHRALRGLMVALFGMRAMWLLPAPPGARRFLEIGCGSGLRLGIAGDMGWEATGLDISLAPLKVASERGYRGVVGIAEELPFGDQTLDFIALHHVLEHVVDPVEVLRELRRVLKPGGLVQVVVPNAAGQAAREYAERWPVFADPRHLLHFDAHTLSQAVAQGGLQVVWLRTIPDEPLNMQSREVTGVTGPVTRQERRQWRRRAAHGEGELLDMWCRREP